VLTLARVLRLVFVGVVMAIGTLSVLSWGEDAHGRDVAKTMAFTTFVLFQLVNAVNARVEFGTVFSRHSFRNRQLWGALAVVALIQVAVVQVGPLQGLFDTVALDATQWIVCVSVALTVLVAEELRKGLARRRGAH
jgi:Ca2+-transporting ATPase